MKHSRFPEKILKANHRRILKTGPLMKFVLAGSKSRLVIKNHYLLYGWKYDGLEGLFRKDIKESNVYGRQICDIVKDKFNCGGFISSDELPKYGISRKETRMLYDKFNKKPKDRNLIVFSIYDYKLSVKIRSFLTDYLRKSLS